MSIHRHLLPHEFDLLLDEEVGFGIPPLWGHIRDCSQCAAELKAAKAALAHVERLPHLAPAPPFADRVMTQVRVFRPWHAAALDIARRLVPQPGPVRTAVATAAALAAVTLTATALWAATRVDAFLLLVGLAAEQVRIAAMGVVGTLFGAAGVAAAEAGGRDVIAAAAAALLVSGAIGIAWIARAARTARAQDR